MMEFTHLSAQGHCVGVEAPGREVCRHQDHPGGVAQTSFHRGASQAHHWRTLVAVPGKRAHLVSSALSV